MQGTVLPHPSFFVGLFGVLSRGPTLSVGQCHDDVTIVVAFEPQCVALVGVDDGHTTFSGRGDGLLTLLDEVQDHLVIADGLFVRRGFWLVFHVSPNASRSSFVSLL